MCKYYHDDDESPGFEIECKHYEEEIQKINEIENKFSVLLKMMFAKMKFDRNEFENCIEDICDILQIKKPDMPLILIDWTEKFTTYEEQR